jgi:hypothetical protein
VWILVSGVVAPVVAIAVGVRVVTFGQKIGQK